MKKSGILLILLMIVLPLSSLAQGGRWVYLGERLVNDRLDNDIIAVTAAKGDFSAVQIRVKGAAIDFHRVVIVYGNGRRQEVELRHTIGILSYSRRYNVLYRYLRFPYQKEPDNHTYVSGVDT